jgi:hypothetical protein
VKVNWNELPVDRDPQQLNMMIGTPKYKLTHKCEAKLVGEWRLGVSEYYRL